MLEPRQDLALVPEAAQDLVGISPTLEQFDRDEFFKLLIGALRQPDGAHTAAAKLAHQFIRSDAPAFIWRQNRLAVPDTKHLRDGIKFIVRLRE